MTDSAAPLFKSKTRKSNIRKRSVSPPADGNDEPEVVIQQTEKKPRQINSISSQQKPKEKIDLSLEFAHAASGTTQNISNKNTATATNEIDTDLNRDQKAILERALKLQETLTGEEADTYLGQNAYRGAVSKSKIRIGPTRASANIRITSRFDYQPDICKDYKETGYCGYGDSCIYLHDRSDYKRGWELDRDWEKEQKQKREAELRGDNLNEEKKEKEEELPFACFICRKEFEKPVVTQCEHYFCESCAIKQFKKSPKCFVCGAKTNGIYNPAKKIIQRMEKKKSVAK